MELDAAYRKPQVSKDEMDQRRKGKLCFECGKEGHMANFHRKGKTSKPWKKRKQLNATERGTPRQLCVAERKGKSKATQEIREETQTDDTATYVSDEWSET
jgi:hypothetical protein